MVFWVILNFRSSAKIRPFFFGSWSKVLLMIWSRDNFLAFDRTHYWNFRSSEKSQKIRSSENETFDHVKNDNFNQVKFGLTTPVFHTSSLIQLIDVREIVLQSYIRKILFIMTYKLAAFFWSQPFYNNVMKICFFHEVFMKIQKTF